MNKVLIILSVIFVLSLTGCNDVEERTCKEGTIEDSGECIVEGSASLECGEGTIEDSGECIPERTPLDTLNEFFTSNSDYFRNGTTVNLTNDLKENETFPFWNEEYEDNYLRFSSTYDETENSIELISSIKYDDDSGSYMDLKIYLYNGNVHMEKSSYSEMGDYSNNFQTYDLTYNIFSGEKTCVADYDPNFPEYYSCENNIMIEYSYYGVYIDGLIDYVDYILSRAGLELVDFKVD